MKSLKYIAKDFDEQWNGEYIISMINAKQHIDIETELLEKKKQTDLSYYKALLMLACIKKDGKPLQYKKEELLEKMPSKLYLVLNSACDRLNNITLEDQRFLSEM